MAKVTMPQLGESVAEGTIGRWLKKPGDRVEKYEPIVEVITDKVNAEVPSPFAGTLTAILVEEGATVPNETPIAEIEPAEAVADASAPPRHRPRPSNATEPSAAPAAAPRAARVELAAPQAPGGAAPSAATLRSWHPLPRPPPRHPCPPWATPTPG